MRLLEEITNDARYAINHIDDVMARKLLTELGQFVLAQNLQQADPGLFQKLQKLMLQLKIVNFPNLSEDDAMGVLRSHYLDSFEIEVPMENRLTAMLFFYPEIPRDDLRKKLKAALLENKQRLGPLTVTQWIAEFEKMFEVRSRKLSASVEFVSKHPKAIFLNSLEKSHLQELLYTYDYLLVTTLPATGPVLDQILATDVTTKTAFHSEEASNRINQASGELSSRNNYAQNLITLSITDAMKQFPEIGEQMITTDRISLKNFPDQVRPSLKNWLADYVFTVGYGNTDAIKRSNYIYHSQNTMRLSEEERRKLAYILKAHDDNSEISIDTAGKRIVFEVPSQGHLVSSGEGFQRTPNVPSYRPQPQSSASLHNSVSFSSPQKMPYEKLNAPQPAKQDFVSQVKFPPVQQVRPTNPVNNIVRLEPKPEKPREMPRNVVNLREE